MSCKPITSYLMTPCQLSFESTMLAAVTVTHTCMYAAAVAHVILMVAVWYLRVTQATRVLVVCQGGWLAGCGGPTDPLEDPIPSRLSTDAHHHCTAPLFNNGASLFHELILQQTKAAFVAFWLIGPRTEMLKLPCGKACFASGFLAPEKKEKRLRLLALT